MLQIQRLLSHYNIPYLQEGAKNKHTRPGWIQINCPFCKGSQNYHLGYCLYQGYFTCWRCGFHSETETISTLLKLDWKDTKLVMGTYKGHGSARKALNVPTEGVSGVCHLPKGSTPLQTQHKAYLNKRGYDSALIKHWGAIGTLWGSRPYSYRIIAPIFFQGELVSFQGRDFTGKSHLKYMTASKENEKVHHKHIVYGYDAVPGTSVVIVEGFMDVWKLGPGAVATFGIKYTKEQVQLLSSFRNRFVMFDTEDGEARKQAKQLAYDLAGYGGYTEIVKLPFAGKDPGDLTHKQGSEVMLELLT